MADFSTRPIADTPNFVTPDRAVAPATPAGPAIASQIFGGLNQLLESRAGDKRDKALSDFSQQQLALADAVDQGQLSSRAARSRMRANFVSAIGNNPSLQEDYLKIHSNLINTSGLGKIAQEGTEEEIRTNALDSKLVESGFVAPNATEQEFSTARTNFELAQEADRRLKSEMENIKLTRERLGLTEAENEFAQEMTTSAITKAMTDSAPHYLDRFNTALEGALTSEEVNPLQAIEQVWSDFNAEFSYELGQLDDNTRNALVKPFELQYENAKKLSTGEFDITQFEAESRRILAMQTKLRLSDPRIAAAASISKLFGSLPEADLKRLNLITSEILAGNAVNTGAPANLFTEGSDGYTRVMDHFLEQEELSETEAEELTTHVTNILEGVETYQNLVDKDAISAKPIIELFSSKNFYEYLQANGGTLPQEAIAQANDILTRHYSDEVWGMVKDEFLNNEVIFSEQVATLAPKPGSAATSFSGPTAVTMENKRGSTQDHVSYRTNGNGIEFFTDSDDPSVQNKVTGLNRNLAPVINETSRAFAHLQGRTDYGAFVQENLEAMFNPDFDSGGELELGDFQQQLEEIETSGGVVGSVIDAGAGFTVVKNEEGVVERRTGTRAWRNNNPGNIEYGKFARSQGAVGSDGRFAVFPSYEKGREAKEHLLFNTAGYAGKTIKSAIARYAPSFENDSAGYANQIAAAAGVSVDTLLESLSPEQREALLDAMERVEGFKQGSIKIVEE